MPVFALFLTMLAGAGSPAQVDLSGLFTQGKEWNAWLGEVRVQRDTWREVTSQANPPAALVERLRKAGADLRLLVIADAACSDSVQTLPHIAALAERAGVPFRIVDKSAGTAAIDGHRTPDGRTATPTVILLRGSRDAGAWVERPVALQTWFLAHGGLSRTERLERKTAWYQWDRGESALAEIVALAEKAADRRP